MAIRSDEDLRSDWDRAFRRARLGPPLRSRSDDRMRSQGEKPHVDDVLAHELHLWKEDPNPW
eukprot:5208048-Pyramimonas_sp.AAC.1